MLVELHILQHFAPSNLNRDDTGAPKDCLFGGVRRARISSQCIKRAIRLYAQEARLLNPEHRAVRTKRLIGEIARRLAARGRDGHQSQVVARRMLQSVGILPMADAPEKTQYLLFVGEDEIAQLVALAARRWDDLVASEDEGASEQDQSAAAGRSRRDRKQAARAAVPSDIQREVARIFNEASSAVDLALFGRMIADLPLGRVDAACQVAHALSTHQVSVEFDYYTAVDDLLPQETTGADMIGTIEFNSACFYRYANVDTDQLEVNLGRRRDLAREGLEAFLRAAIYAVPTGKQNTFAAHNPPSFVATVVRRRGLWALTNAFVRPVRPTDERDLVQESIRALDRYWGKLISMYGKEGIDGWWVATHEPEQLESLRHNPACLVSTVDELVQATVAKVYGPEARDGQ
ncbi:MAG: type I-E CRISPR-associated protein Cas7/Cse4/CasC [Thermomicrobium sp.]|nr:type I-E CRISPR-associated protein Cas7/Cse4/CasC [Thermomicrobium sp.]